MKGPCACPQCNEIVLLYETQMNPVVTRGQAQSPYPTTHPPLVPTRSLGASSFIRSSKFIRLIAARYRPACPGSIAYCFDFPVQNVERYH
jgi:hypothetical protein